MKVRVLSLHLLFKGDFFCVKVVSAAVRLLISLRISLRK
jgi:hypothetical protein